MEFLDPVAKRKRGIRLMTGYVLVGILLFTATFILMYRAYGFGVDSKTGEVVQNGLVYIDSAPDNADVFLNGDLQKDRSNARYSLPAGKYELVIRKDGYRDWSRSIELFGGSVLRITYPLLVLQNLEKLEVANLGGVKPEVSTQSPDRRWLLVQIGASYLDFNEYELAKEDAQFTPAVRTVTFPESIFTSSPEKHILEVVEWSTDNNHLLVKHSFGAAYEFVVLTREKPEESFNINKLLALNPTKVTLHDKKFDKWYIYTEAGGILQTADTNKNIQTVSERVASYKTHGSKVVLLAKANESGGSTVYFLDNNNEVELRDLPSGAVTLNVAGFDGAMYPVISSDGAGKTYVYKDSNSFIIQRDNLKPLPVFVMDYKAPIKELEFSSNARFIMNQDGVNKLHVYDLEKNESYVHDSVTKQDGSSRAVWMDGHRVMSTSAGTVQISDFDGTNLQSLVGPIEFKGYFNRDYTVLYTVSKPDAEVATPTWSLIRSSLRLDEDK